MQYMWTSCRHAPDRPCSQLELLSNLLVTLDRSTRPPPKTYFGASVLPSSTTSGPLLAWSAASSCWRWLPQLVKLTFTSAPVSALKRAMASFRIGSHLGFCASAMIQALTVCPAPLRLPLSAGPAAGVLLFDLLP